MALSPKVRFPCIGTILASLPLLSALSFQGFTGTFHFVDVTQETGIDFQHTDGSTGERHIVESVSCGLALFDFDNDNDIDIYFLNGTNLKSDPSAPPVSNRLYRNDGNWKFTDITDQAGVGDQGYGLGICVGDYDNDGHADLYLNNFGPNVLYRNNGGGTFSDVTAKAGVSNGSEVGAGTCFLDIDNDGDLDLFVANYIQYRPEDNKQRIVNGHPAYPGPMLFGPASDTLYRNNGDGTFTDISQASGIANHKGTSMGAIASDYDGDGDTDIIVGNDAMGNYVYQNDGSGSFQEVGLLTGLAYDLHGQGQGTMGVECADYDNDGLLDFYMTSYQKQWATLYKNLGQGYFSDVTMMTGAGIETLPRVTWGTGLVDFDNDGHRDIYIACGHLQDNIGLWDDSGTYRSPNVFLANNGNGKFISASKAAGPGLKPIGSSRGAAFDDLDNDGDVDVVILNSRQAPTILKNASNTDNAWLRVHLRGTKSNRDGVGAMIKVTVGDKHYIDEVRSGRGYQSAYQSQPHFGLGKTSTIQQIEVTWPSGAYDVFQKVPPNQLYKVTEGTGNRP